MKLLAALAVVIGLQQICQTDCWVDRNGNTHCTTVCY